MKHDERPLLLVTPGTSYRIEDFVRAARRLGISMAIATDLVGAASKFGLPVYRVSFTDARVAYESFAGDRFSGVVAVDERSAWLAAQLAEARIVEGAYHSTTGVAAARDKRAMRAMLTVAGVRVPDYLCLPALAPAALISPSFPCVCKPAMLSGSQGVIRADDTAGLAAAVARIRAILAGHPSELRMEPGFAELLVESYIDGEEVAVEASMHAGELELIAVFDKPEPLTGPFFEETLYVAPSRKSPAVLDAVVRTVKSAALALGLTDGPIHAELRLALTGPVLIEIAARSIGGLCSRALVHVVGSLEERMLCAAAGLPLPPLVAAPPATGVMMIPVPRSGVLRSVAGIAEARAVPGIDAVAISVAPGETVRAIPEGGSYLGFIFSHAAEPAEVELALRQAHAKLQFALSPLLPQLG
ncbi:MAG: ATP-grasp domain-containing protein [Myxococcales bacterium]|nr:ATP-grasp domain-containing protein [Myxococcales bacterium]